MHVDTTVITFSGESEMGGKSVVRGFKRAAVHAASKSCGPTAPIDTVALATEFKRSLQRRLETATAEVVTQEYTHAFWFLRLLEIRARQEAGLPDYPSKKVKDPDGIERIYSTFTNDKSPSSPLHWSLPVQWHTLRSRRCEA